MTCGSYKGTFDFFQLGEIFQMAFAPSDTDVSVTNQVCLSH